MSDYLLHQKRDGTPVGIWLEDAHHYPDRYESFEDYGSKVVAARGSAVEWSDFIDQLSEKTPTPTARWSVYSHEEAALEIVIQDALLALEDD